MSGVYSKKLIARFKKPVNDSRKAICSSSNQPKPQNVVPKKPNVNFKKQIANSKNWARKLFAWGELGVALWKI